MDNYKPYSYLYKNESETPKKLKSCFTVQIPAGKRIVLRSGDPSNEGNTTMIRYIVESVVSQPIGREEYFENEFDWDGQSRNVLVRIGDGRGDEGGETVMSSDDAEID